MIRALKASRDFFEWLTEKRRSRWIRAMPVTGKFRKPVVAVLGAVLVLFGVAAIPLPLPGAALIVAGLAVLATEFVWAQSLRRTISARLASVGHRVSAAVRRPPDGGPD